jgi:hypothetical protein
MKYTLQFLEHLIKVRHVDNFPFGQKINQNNSMASQKTTVPITTNEFQDGLYAWVLPGFLPAGGNPSFQEEQPENLLINLHLNSLVLFLPIILEYSG